MTDQVGLVLIIIIAFGGWNGRVQCIPCLVRFMKGKESQASTSTIKLNARVQSLHPCLVRFIESPVSNDWRTGGKKVTASKYHHGWPLKLNARVYPLSSTLQNCMKGKVAAQYHHHGMKRGKVTAEYHLD